MTHPTLGSRQASGLVAVAALALLTGGCGNPSSTAPATSPPPSPTSTGAAAVTSAAPAGLASVAQALADAERRWSTAGVVDYRLSVAEDRNYWTAGCTWTMVVTAGTVTDAGVAGPAGDAGRCVRKEWTVEQLHDQIAGMLDAIGELGSADAGQDTLEVSFDELGVPVSIEYDLAYANDEEASMRVTFEALP
jgi:Family of unknown function (DUF6174)